MSATSMTTQRSTYRTRNNVTASLMACWAIVRRDLLVMRREAITLAVQMLMQPLFFLFVFGKVLPTIGGVASGFSTLLMPGIVAFTIFVTTLQGPSVELARDLGFTREIEDRLLAPLPIALVALEKLLLSALRGVLAGALVFPLAAWILGSGYQVRTDQIGILIGVMVLVALAGAALGLVLAAAAPLQLLPLLFALVLTPLIFTGCTFYPWTSLDTIKWFQVLTLFNPLTYAAEGLRYAMIPPANGLALQTLDIRWVLLALSAAFIACLCGGISLFRRRVIS
jgi:ABC-2 type transport system permease protein